MTKIMHVPLITWSVWQTLSQPAVMPQNQTDANACKTQDQTDNIQMTQKQTGAGYTHMTQNQTGNLNMAPNQTGGNISFLRSRYSHVHNVY